MKEVKKSFDKVFERRIRAVLLFFLVACAVLVGRLFIMQVVRHSQYTNLAIKQHGLTEELSSERGMILAVDKDGAEVPLALNKTYKVLVASPKTIKHPEETASLLASVFSLNQADVLARLSKAGDPYEIIARRIESQAAEEFLQRGIEGISFEDEMRRVYPNGTMASHLLGFVSGATGGESGQYGIERFFENELSGAVGLLSGMKDASGFLLALGRRVIHPPENGSSVTLTIDYSVQRKAEDVLAAAVSKWGASSGLVIVLDPKTGRILAEASRPAFDPNAFSGEKDFSIFLNPAVEASYELGSVMKPITMAAALEEKKVTPDSTYNDTGEVRIGSFTIRNFDGNAYHTQTMTQVLEKSLNTGLVHVARLLGKAKQEEYFGRFGFGDKTGIDLPGEVAGDLSNLEHGRDSDFATASFGQGIAVTPIQLAAATAAIANKGVLMKPYVVEKIRDDSGNETMRSPETVRSVISPETAETLTKMLVSVVKNGYEDRAGVKGYLIAGKTGTAQIPRRDGKGYMEDGAIHTFVGYAPAFDPKFLILIQLNEPKGNRFAANTLTPVFHDLAEFILHYYEVPPDEK
ncbi:MAG: hypothetical protein A3J58_01130 [Candidatus Sungbacteria bacterium RIFCSPHIGHO2_02_FULL_52_23]|uniref:Penicillin-binding protein transpeptidase domain-containing protein n=1 Tax=Candidatus Sungbacteria bacterium RIFCSPHIGHO2_02_FULL_52_23 TaxID=1802274 RepID=A0A1G2KY99_9BACT|nr:MAG: hypothetical protein A3J58_01130 [Candidatus Sungbacteria bacterium RIFCSPHIGHO2_02_FULL_52_23]